MTPGKSALSHSVYGKDINSGYICKSEEKNNAEAAYMPEVGISKGVKGVMLNIKFKKKR